MSRGINSIDIETGVIVGVIVSLIVGTGYWIFRWLALEAKQRAEAEAIRTGAK